LVSTLNNKAEQERLIISLQDSNDASFNRINAIKIEVGGKDIFEADPVVRNGEEQPIPGGGINLVLIVAPVVGAVCAVVFVVGLFMLVKKRNANRRALDGDHVLDDDVAAQGGGAGAYGNNDDDEDVGYIEVKNQRDDDISTIGDPLGAWGHAHHGGATVGTNHYDDNTVGEKYV
jgi:hypothetical protein